jgi:hypothetical protein
MFRASKSTSCFHMPTKHCGWDVDSVSLLSRPVSTTAAVPTRALITIRAAACRLLFSSATDAMLNRLGRVFSML